MTQASAERIAGAGFGTHRPAAGLLERFVAHVERDGAAPAVRDDHSAWVTRSGLWRRAEVLADRLRSQGVDAGDVVVLCLPNGVAWLEVFLACLQVRAVPATLPVTSDAGQLRYACGLVGADLLIVPATSRGRDYRAEWTEPTCCPVLAATPSVASPTEPRVAGDAPSVDLVFVVAGTAGTQPKPQQVDGLAHLMFTSSTTGMPKAVQHTEATLAAVNAGFAARFELDASSGIFMASPLGHSVGAWHGARLALYLGAPLVLQERWDPTAALDLIAAEQCVFTAAATPFLNDLVSALEAAPTDAPGALNSMRVFLCGGAPVPPALVLRATTVAPNTFVSVLWGMTEGGVTTGVPGEPAERTLRTAGRALPGLDLCTVAPAGDRLPPDTEGELAMRGPGVFVGYLGQPDLYHELVTAEGYFRTGDQALVDADGYVKITGRLKDFIIRGGVNISPLPLENALAAHPSISDVAVVGTPDARLGERICAVVTVHGEPPTLGALLDWLTERGVPRRLHPERLVVVDDMPRTAAGKIRKLTLRDQIGAGS